MGVGMRWYLFTTPLTTPFDIEKDLPDCLFSVGLIR